MLAAERYVIAGLARARADWFRTVGQWATAGAAPIEFVRCVSVSELRSRLTSGRPFSAVMLEGDLVGVDRDLLAVARESGAAVLVVTDRADRDWASLGAAAVLPTDLSREQLLDVLGSKAMPVRHALADPDADGDDRPGRERAGRVIAVTGAGGVGTSTAAIALAEGLAAEDDDVLLADLQRYAEQAMLHDTRVVVPGIQELVEAHRTSTPAVAQVRDQTFHVEARGYHLLLGLRRSAQWVTLRPRALEAAIASLRRSFELIVCDVAPDLEGEAETSSIDVEERNLPARLAVAHAEVVVAVGQPTLKGLYSLVRVIGELVAYGTPPERIVPVLNQAPRSPKKRAELSRSLADLVLTQAGARSLPNPVFLPDKPVDQALRDGVGLPKPLPATLAAAVRGVLARTDGPRPETAAEPVPVAPGSLGTIDPEELSS